MTSLFPAELSEAIVRKIDAVQRQRKIGITMLVWLLILGLTVDSETRSTASFQRAYQTATIQTVARSSSYDRFTPELCELPIKFPFAHARERVAIPHTIAAQLTRFRDTMVADATVSRLHRLLTAFPATHED